MRLTLLVGSIQNQVLYLLQRSITENSTPKIGWDGQTRLNHFELVEKLKTISSVLDCEIIRNLCNDDSLEAVINMIHREFSPMMSKERRCLIELCLRYRHGRIKKILNFEP